jgi:hypothetical protein
MAKIKKEESGKGVKSKGNDNISNTGTYFGSVNADQVDIHHDTGNGEVLEVREQQMERMYKVLIDELHRFHDVIMNKDEYSKKQDARIKKQGEKIDRIVKHSYLRNKENMERLDRMFLEIGRAIDQQNKLIDQQNKLIDASNEDRVDMRRQMDRILTMLESKILK